MNVNNLTFSSDTFLRIIREIDGDTLVHYLDIKAERIWEGFLCGSTIVIRCLVDPREIREVMKLYCPGWKVGTLAKLSKDDLDFNTETDE